MIPRKIHYCWFGRNPLPESALKCIASWKKYFPDYEIIEWNEDNFDVNTILYTKQAYEAKKYAFVSDYARFRILYEHGGLYFDTDVEVIKPMDDIIAKGSFMGFEINATDENPGVNPGLGLGVKPEMQILAEILAEYQNRKFFNQDGSLNEITIVKYTTDVLFRHGLERIKGIQQVEDIYLYPSDYFNPLEDTTGLLRLTDNTRSIHWYAKTWYTCNPLRIRLSRLAHRIFGVKFSGKIRRLFRI